MTKPICCKLNLSKSECYPVNNLALQIQDNVLPFKMSRNGFKYLGINITRDMKNIYQENVAPLLVKVKLDLKKWRSLHLSLAGKVNCIKMGVLPKFLCSNVSHFSYLDLSLNVLMVLLFLILNGKIPRVRIDLLQRPKYREA